jgi:hypothetical protein
LEACHACQCCTSNYMDSMEASNTGREGLNMNIYQKIQSRYGVSIDNNHFQDTAFIINRKCGYAYININYKQNIDIYKLCCLKYNKMFDVNIFQNTILLHELGHYLHYKRGGFLSKRRYTQSDKVFIQELQANKYATLVAYDLNIPVYHEVLRYCQESYKITKKMKKRLDKLTNRVYSETIEYRKEQRSMKKELREYANNNTN